VLLLRHGQPVERNASGCGACVRGGKRQVSGAPNNRGEFRTLERTAQDLAVMPSSNARRQTGSTCWTSRIHPPPTGWDDADQKTPSAVGIGEPNFHELEAARSVASAGSGLAPGGVSRGVTVRPVSKARILRWCGHHFDRGPGGSVCVSRLTVACNHASDATKVQGSSPDSLVACRAVLVLSTMTVPRPVGRR
jgi:hypothetical protein